MALAQSHDVSLAAAGDDLERQHWDALRARIPGYEEVWKMHVYPLRCPGSVRLRAGLDEDFERFAMCHYTTYVQIARASLKIEQQVDDFKFAEEIWANLQRALEVAEKAIEHFQKIHRDCLGQKLGGLHQSDLRKALDRIRQYRNALHDPIWATVKDAQSQRRMVPRPEFFEKYRNWTTVMYHCVPAEFIAVEERLNADFAAACSALESIWSKIRNGSTTLISNAEYLKRRSAGNAGMPSFGTTAQPFSASGATVIGSNG